MISGVRYVHTNLIARDWQSLAKFYQDCFGCIFMPPERDYSGRELEAGTGIPGARLRGVHLCLPGHGANGPTLEIFSYEPLAPGTEPAPNRPGLGHLAFEVQSVADARREVLLAGGRSIGDVVALATSSGKSVTWCYVRDPEDNIIELQSWSS